MNERTKIITKQALALPREEQEALYRALAESLGLPDESIEEAWLDESGAPYRLSQSEEEAVAEGRAQARRGEFVSDEEVAAFYKRHGL